MTRLKIVLLFISLFLWRWASLASPLPRTWTPDSTVRFTATVIDGIQHTDTQTIIRSGLWYIPLRGYAVIISGSRVTFSGKVTPRVQMGKVTKIVMLDPTFDIIASPQDHHISLLERVTMILDGWRDDWVHLLEKWLPEPMASLSAGILLGYKAEMPANFYQSLVNTGTLHIIAASGYNVSIVLAVMMGITLKLFSRKWAIIVGLLGVLAYVTMAGAGASVVRAAVMGGLTLVAFYTGRPVEAKRLLWLSAALMLLVQPLLLLDVGFQLSFLATAGLFYIEPFIRRRLERILQGWDTFRVYLAEYLYPTLAASISTLPVILWHFGRVSWISPLVNILVLPLVPLIMGLTAIAVGVGLVIPGLGQFITWLLYPSLWWMVTVIHLFGR